MISEIQTVGNYRTTVQFLHQLHHKGRGGGGVGKGEPKDEKI